MASITLIITMAATFVPCCKYDGCEDEKTVQKGTCSPLSSCASCAVAIIVTRNVEVAAIFQNKNIFSYPGIDHTLPSFYSSFWQPPRVS